MCVILSKDISENVGQSFRSADLRPESDRVVDARQDDYILKELLNAMGTYIF